MARSKDKTAQWTKLKRDCGTFLSKIYGEAEKKIMVFGEGSIPAALMLVGEAPGEQETVQQRPFVGTAGKNLDDFISILEIERDELYITNVVKFRPTKRNPNTLRLSNRPPNREEVLLCAPYLREEINLIEPKVIISLGNVALRAVSGQDKATIGQCHGTPMRLEDGRTLFPLYHPASVIYNRALKEVYLEDLQSLKQFIC